MYNAIYEFREIQGDCVAEDRLKHAVQHCDGQIYHYFCPAGRSAERYEGKQQRPPLFPLAHPLPARSG